MTRTRPALRAPALAGLTVACVASALLSGCAARVTPWTQERPGAHAGDRAGSWSLLMLAGNGTEKPSPAGWRQTTRPGPVGGLSQTSPSLTR